MRMRTLNLSVMALTTALAFLGLFVAATAEKRAPESANTPEAVKSRLENVSRLVKTSSGARRIEAGSNAQAKAKRAAAQQYLEEAEAAFTRNLQFGYYGLDPAHWPVPGRQRRFVDVELVRVDGALHDGFAEAVGRRNENGVAEAGLGVDRELPRVAQPVGPDLVRTVDA